MNNTLIQVNSNGMGQGEMKLSLVLIENYLKTLLQENILPKMITFYNSGVQLLVDDSPVIAVLIELEQKGVKLIACKTCLNYYGKADKQKVGMAGTMIDLIALHQKASKVITL